MNCPGCGSSDHTHNIGRHQTARIPIPPCNVGDRAAWLAWLETPDGQRYVEAQRAQTAAAIEAAGALEGRDLVEALRNIGARRGNVLEAIVARAGGVIGATVDELVAVEGCQHQLCSMTDTIAEAKIAEVLKRILSRRA